jgi:anti-anti-sigma factor
MVELVVVRLRTDARRSGPYRGRAFDEGTATMTLEVTAAEGETLRLHGELDLATSDRLVSEISTYIQPGRDLEVDVMDLHFVDSAGMRALLSVAQRCAPGVLVLNQPQHSLMTILRILGLGPRHGIVVREDPCGPEPPGIADTDPDPVQP